MTTGGPRLRGGRKECRRPWKLVEGGRDEQLRRIYVEERPQEFYTRRRAAPSLWASMFPGHGQENPRRRQVAVLKWSALAKPTQELSGWVAKQLVPGNAFR
jgi:hypothetical protein